MSIRLFTAKVNHWIIKSIDLTVLKFVEMCEIFETSDLGRLELEAPFDHHWKMVAELSKDYYTLELKKFSEDLPIKKVIIERDKLILLKNLNPKHEFEEVGVVFFNENFEMAYHMAIKDLCEEQFSYDNSLWGMEAHTVYYREEGLFCTCKDNDTGELYDYPL